ncbi:MAG: YscQ/HrcQ family type III secretion apparatus protein [Kluyvera sp.]
MTLIFPEESEVAGRLQEEGIDLGDLHIASRLWTDSQAGRLFSVTVEGTLCEIWLAENDWQNWCEGTLGTSLAKDIDPQLLAGVAEWGLSPLLMASGAKLHSPSGEPTRCSILNHYLAVIFAWQVDCCSFRAVLFGWPASWFHSIVQKITARPRPVHLLPPASFSCYAGWCEVSVNEIRNICIGVGLRVNSFGHPRDGEFVAVLATGSAVRIRIESGEYVKIEELVNDMESLLAESGDDIDASSSLSLHLDTLPQKILVEVGQIDITLGALRTLREGDLLATEVRLTPEVRLRLNGRVIGQGELIACGDNFVVRVTQWFLHSEDTLMVS